MKAGLSAENEYAGCGITHYIEHMIFKGSPEMGAGGLASAVKSYGGYINATTSLDTTTFFITVPADHIEECVTLLAKAVMAPAFNAKEVEKEKDVILNEIRLRYDDPEDQLFDALFSTAYLAHAYKNPIIGYEDLFKKLKREDLLKYHRAHYVPNNMIVAVAGAVDKGRVLEVIKSAFSKYPRSANPITLNDQEPEQTSERITVRPSDINLGYIAIGFHSTSVSDKDLPAVDLCASLLGEGDGSRLVKTLVKEKRLLFSVTASNYTPRDPGLFIITGIGDVNKLKEAVDVIETEIEKLKNEGPTQEEYEKLKRKAQAVYYSTLESVNSQAGLLAEGQAFVGDPRFVKHYTEKLMEVTPQEIIQGAKYYLTQDNRTVVYLAPKMMEEEISNTVFGRSEGEFGKGDIEARKYTLDNGIQVILKENHLIPRIALTYVCLGGARLEPSDKGGLSDIMSKMLLKGTKARKESEIMPAMENIGGYISSFNGYNSFGINMEFYDKDAEFSLSLLKDAIENPVFPEDELAKIKGINKAEIAVEDNDAFDKAVYELRKGIFKSHPYSRRVSGEIDSIDRITRNDVERFYKEMKDPGNMVISAVGNFISDDMLRMVKKNFSEIEAGHNKRTSIPEEAMRSREEKVVKMPKEEAVYLIGFNGVTYNDPDRYPLDLLYRVLSGHDGRLFDSIRDAFGLSYSQGGSYVPGLEPGFLYFYIASGPADIYKAKGILEKEINRIKKEMVADGEMSSSKNALIASALMNMQTNMSKCSTMALDELHIGEYNHYEKYAENIMKCAKSDIIRVANKYLDINKSFAVLIIPDDSK